MKKRIFAFLILLVLLLSACEDKKADEKAAATPKPAPTEDAEKTPAPKPKRVPGALPSSTPKSETGSGPKKTPMSPSALDTETSVETQSEPQETASDGYSIMFGDLLDANPSGGVDGNTLVIKAKIHSQITNKQTINQNYHNVEDIIKNQGGDQFNCIDYWAVADMSDGSEQKVVAFTVDSNVIQGVANGNIVAIEFEDYVDDLFIHQSLR